MCNSNAMYYQQMVHQAHGSYLTTFLEQGFNIFLWNYRGYGMSDGAPTPLFLQQDAEVVLEYIKTTLKVEGKVGVYGRSLGGIPSTQIIDKVDLALIDRTFSNLEDMAQYRFYSKITRVLFRVGSFGWNAQNDVNFLKRATKPVYKVILHDTRDAVVSLQA